MIEGIGRMKSDGALVLQALGLISFDDVSGKYQMRAFNDGRWLETEVKFLDEPDAISWGFSLGEISTRSVLRTDERGNWVEHGELSVGARPWQKLIDLTVSRIS